MISAKAKIFQIFSDKFFSLTHCSLLFSINLSFIHFFSYVFENLVQTAQQISYPLNFNSSLLMTNVIADTNTQLITEDQYAFESAPSNAHSLTNNLLYLTELNYITITGKKIDPKFGLIQVQIPQRKVVFCAKCDKEMEVKEGTVIYDRQWFHDACWDVTIKGNDLL